MRIGIYTYPDQGGSRRYYHDLVQTLPIVGQQHAYYLYMEAQGGFHRQVRHHAFIRRLFSNARTATWARAQIDLPRRLHRDRLDLFQTQYHRFPVDTPCPTVVIIHDAIPALFPHWMGPRPLQRSATERFSLAIQLADHVIVPSQHTRWQLVEALKVPPEKVTRIYPGCPRLFHPLPRDQARQAVQARFRIARPYLLSVGPILQRKNHPMLIRAFHRRLSKQFTLVMVGPLGNGGRRVQRLIDGDQSVSYVGSVTDEELRALYAAAECLAYPSQEEGFGFPPLEAMACGTPVVALKRASLPEVVGDAGLLVEPGSVRRLAEALEAIVEDRRLCETLRARGLRRARQFRWEETARQTLAVYEKVIQGR